MRSCPFGPPSACRTWRRLATAISRSRSRSSGARRHRQQDEAALIHLALARLRQAVGQEGFTPRDHELLAACSDDPARRLDLQTLLLGRYFKTRRTDAAGQLAETMTADVTAALAVGPEGAWWPLLLTPCMAS